MTVKYRGFSLKEFYYGVEIVAPKNSPLVHHVFSYVARACEAIDEHLAEKESSA